MSNLSAKQKAALAKGRQKLSRKRNGGLSGISLPKFNVNQATDVLMKGGEVVVAAAIGRTLTQKVFKSDQKEGFKKYLGAIAKAAGGFVLATQKNQHLNFIGYGLAGEAIVEAIGHATNRDILANGILEGLEGLNISGLLGNTDIEEYNEYIDDPSYQLEQAEHIDDVQTDFDDM